MGWPKGANQGLAQMIKILVAAGGAALLAGTIVLLSGMTPIDPAVSAQAYGKIEPAKTETGKTEPGKTEPGKGDRVDIRDYGPGCTERGWPYYEPNCLRATENNEVKRVRVVTADRLPADIPFATSK
jgi:hypothetical protein